MPIFAVTYQYTDDSAARDRFRPEHRAFLVAHDDEKGPVVRLESGPWKVQPDQSDGALLIFRGPDAEAVASALESDPFYREGLVAQRQVREWSVISGPWTS